MFGAKALNLDKAIWNIDFEEAGNNVLQNMEPRYKEFLKSYVDGINY